MVDFRSSHFRLTSGSLSVQFQSSLMTTAIDAFLDRTSLACRLYWSVAHQNQLDI